LTYIRTEIQEEQWVRKIDPFRRFIAVAAQMNGNVVNYSSIARDVGVDPVTVQSYYEILEDTLMGFYLPAYHRSIRKQQRKAPKFYLFDCGIVRALRRVLNIDTAPQTHEYGRLFEHFIVLEVFRINHYLKSDFELSYLLTKENVEIDLIIDRPGKPTALVEIKSKQRVDDRDTHHLESIAEDIDDSECFLLSQDSTPKVIGRVNAVPWEQGLQALFDHGLRKSHD
jgi:predicted AAA+ superfamily ATPase